MIMLLGIYNGIDAETDSSKHPIFRALSWTLFSAVALYSTKQLMTTFHYHYPATIALQIFGTLLLGYFFILAWNNNVRESVPIKFSYRPKTEWTTLRPHRSWIRVMPAAIGASITLPVLLNAILYMENISSLVMLTPLAFAAKWLTSMLCTFSGRHMRTGMCALLLIFGSCVVVCNERRLSHRGLFWGLASICSMGITKGLMDTVFDEVEHNDDKFESTELLHGFISMSLVVGFVISFCRAVLHEEGIFSYDLPTCTSLMVIFSLFSFVAAIVAGTSPVVYSPISNLKATSNYEYESGPAIPGALISSIPVLLVLLATSHFQPEVVITTKQLFGYFFSLTCATGLDGRSTFGTVKQGYKYLRKSQNSWDSKLLVRGIVLLIPTYLALGLVFVQSSKIMDFPQPRHSAVLDDLYAPSSRFDIVVSIYKEEPEAVRKVIESFKATKMLRHLIPRVIIYTKNNYTDVTALQIATGADIVISLENRGREGATYLNHIVNHWDDLATQTLFIQAQPHDMSEILAQTNAYLVPETGMLSLGITGIQCTCNSCEDTSPWLDTWNMIPELYEKIHHESCDDDTKILMTYAGQFIASAKRIRGIEKEIYKELLDALTSTHGWAHDPDKLGNEKVIDSVERPKFGYTTERTWGLLMQCATNVRIAKRCPSLLSGRWVQGEVEDCQCLDS